jgi:hypothetical protein
MKLAMAAICVLGMGFFLFNLAGCQTDTPGATETLGVYSTMVDGSPDKVAGAAKMAADDLKLTDVVVLSTKIDGKVTAKTAMGDAVTINISQAGENVSKVSIHIGATGDQAVSKQLVDKIKSHLK